MHQHEMTPARLIVNATAVGVLAWTALFLLRSLPFFEPIIIEKLLAVLGYVNWPETNSWHASSESWYGQLLELLHPVVVLGAVAVSAVRDFLELRKVRRTLSSKMVVHHECHEDNPIESLYSRDSGPCVAVTIRVCEASGHHFVCLRYRNCAYWRRSYLVSSRLD